MRVGAKIADIWVGGRECQVVSGEDAKTRRCRACREAAFFLHDASDRSDGGKGGLTATSQPLRAFACSPETQTRTCRVRTDFSVEKLRSAGQPGGADLYRSCPEHMEKRDRKSKRLNSRH